ncbi:MAG: hypothetical protein KDJ16_11800 [Hyphomicrobiales bacterium]|nr:hypothetical protein [Hyphomicrobiales bacterium]
MTAANKTNNVGVEFITIPQEQRPKYVPLTGSAAAIDPVARAEEALAKLAEHFECWLGEEVDVLLRAWAELSKPPAYATGKHNAFYVAAHDLRGEAATFGYPLVSRLAGGICSIMENSTPEDMPFDLIRQHVMAIKAAVREKAEGNGSETARALVSHLAEIVAGVIAPAETRNSAVR